MANILDIGEYARYSIDELVDMIKSLEHRIAVLEEELENEQTAFDRGYKEIDGIG